MGPNDVDDDEESLKSPFWKVGSEFLPLILPQRKPPECLLNFPMFYTFWGKLFPLPLVFLQELQVRAHISLILLTAVFTCSSGSAEIFAQSCQNRHLTKEVSICSYCQPWCLMMMKMLGGPNWHWENLFWHPKPAVDYGRKCQVSKA